MFMMGPDLDRRSGPFLFAKTLTGGNSYYRFRLASSALIVQAVLWRRVASFLTIAAGRPSSGEVIEGRAVVN